MVKPAFLPENLTSQNACEIFALIEASKGRTGYWVAN
jgi:hypothetical protein